MLMKHDNSSSWYGKGIPKKKINNLFKQSKKNLQKNISSKNSKVILLPHAGFDYSGYCITSALHHFLDDNLLPKNKNLYTNIVILSTLHQHSNNIIFSDGDIHNSIFNKISIQQHKIYSYLTKYKFGEINNEIFKSEHSHKNVIPFLEVCFPNIPITPILIGNLKNKFSIIGKTLYQHFNTKKTLWIICTDLLHVNGRFSYKLPEKYINRNIRNIENELLNDIFERKTLQSFNKKMNKFKKNGVLPSICGENVLKLFLTIPFEKLNAKICSYYHSNQAHSIIQNKLIDNDTIGSIVSYCSAIFISNGFEKHNKNNNSNKLDTLLTKYEELVLLEYSKSLLLNHFYKLPVYNMIISPSFNIKKGVFVTLKKNRNLRGCIGTYALHNKLLHNIYTYTHSSAFSDYRFPPLKKDELLKISRSITLLDNKIEIGKTNNELSKWRLGKDGIILQCINNSAIYLPQVPIEQGWNKNKTLESLCQKAGLNKNDWKKTTCRLFIIPGYEFN